MKASIQKNDYVLERELKHEWVNVASRGNNIGVWKVTRKSRVIDKSFILQSLQVWTGLLNLDGLVKYLHGSPFWLVNSIWLSSPGDMTKCGVIFLDEWLPVFPQLLWYISQIRIRILKTDWSSHHKSKQASGFLHYQLLKSWWSKCIIMVLCWVLLTPQNTLASVHCLSLPHVYLQTCWISWKKKKRRRISLCDRGVAKQCLR